MTEGKTEGMDKGQQVVQCALGGIKDIKIS